MSRHLDAALKKLERTREQIERKDAVPQSRDKASNHFGPVVPSPETEVTTSSMASVRAPTCTDAIGNPTLCRISNSTRIEQRIQFDRYVMSHSTQSHPVTLSGLSSVPSVTDLIMSESAQSHVMVSYTISSKLTAIASILYGKCDNSE